MKNPKYMNIEELNTLVTKMTEGTQAEFITDYWNRRGERLQKKTYLKMIESWKKHELPKLKSKDKFEWFNSK